MNFSVLFMLVAMGGLMFWMQRSQKKQHERRMESLSRLSKGNEVVTIGGLYGTVDEVDVEHKRVVLDVDGVYLTFELAAIKSVLPSSETTPVVTEVDESPAEENSAIEE